MCAWNTDAPTGRRMDGQKHTDKLSDLKKIKQ